MNNKKIYPKAIRNWPEDDRPREKLLKYGEHSLSNAELLAILIRIGKLAQVCSNFLRNLM